MKYTIIIYYEPIDVPKEDIDGNAARWIYSGSRHIADYSCIFYSPSCFQSVNNFRQFLFNNDFISDGVYKIDLQSETELYLFISYFNYSVQKNYLLDALMLNPNDAKKDKVHLSSSHRKKDQEKLLRFGYSVKNGNKRTLDLRKREFRNKLFSNDWYHLRMLELGYIPHKKNLSRWEENLRRERGEWYGPFIYDYEFPSDSEKYFNQIVEKTRKSKRVELEHQWWSSRSRGRKLVLQERRLSCDEEHLPFARAKRNLANSPHKWSHRRYKTSHRGWKLGTKVKRQWMVNLKTHIDTIPVQNTESNSTEEIEE